MNHFARQHEAELIMARVGTRLAAGLGEQSLPHDITERLRVAREQALGRARLARRQASAAVGVIAQSGGVAVLGGPPAWWQRAASALPLVVLVAGLLMVGQLTTREQVLAAAEIDTNLLADDLPPDAYADPGFGEFLKSPPP